MNYPYLYKNTKKNKRNQTYDKKVILVLGFLGFIVYTFILSTVINPFSL